MGEECQASDPQGRAAGEAIDYALGVEMIRTTFAVIATMLVASSSAAIARSHTPSREDRLVACLIRQASISLHQQLGTKVDATRAADIAVMYAGNSKACKGSLSEGGLDVVQASVDVMAKIWFEDAAPTPPGEPAPEVVEPSLKLWDQLSK